MKSRAPYQEILNGQSRRALEIIVDEIRIKYAKGLKVDKTAFQTSVNLIRYEMVETFIDEFFNTLEEKANGKR